jgi:hypothetical protein
MESMASSPSTIIRRICGVMLLATGLALTASVGSASMADSSSGNTTANVAVNSSITLSGLTSSFTLSGDPNSTVTSNGVVTMNVLTNNLTGYNVTVQAAAAVLSGSGGNADSIPISDLRVRETGGLAFVPLSNLAPVTVHAQITPSGASGDNLSNDYRVVIPFVSADTYSVTLDYVASTQ